MQNNIIIINGPNINLLGDRDKSIYGSESYVDLMKNCKSEASKKNINIDFYQSNIEGELVTKVQESRKIYDGMIINAAAFTHTSVAIRDALSLFKKPCSSLRRTIRRRLPHCRGWHGRQSPYPFRSRRREEPTPPDS